MFYTIDTSVSHDDELSLISFEDDRARRWTQDMTDTVDIRKPSYPHRRASFTGNTIDESRASVPEENNMRESCPKCPRRLDTFSSDDGCQGSSEDFNGQCPQWRQEYSSLSVHTGFPRVRTSFVCSTDCRSPRSSSLLYDAGGKSFRLDSSEGSSVPKLPQRQKSFSLKPSNENSDRARLDESSLSNSFATVSANAA